MAQRHIKGIGRPEVLLLTNNLIHATILPVYNKYVLHKTTVDHHCVYAYQMELCFL